MNDFDSPESARAWALALEKARQQMLPYDAGFRSYKMLQDMDKPEGSYASYLWAEYVKQRILGS